MTERSCINECTVRDQHWANCPDYGKDETSCKGCVPRECRDGSLICDKCFGRMRFLLSETPDLLARLRSLADPLKATPTDNVRTGGAPVFGPREPNPVDLIDAIDSIQATYATFQDYGANLETVANDVHVIVWLSSMTIDRHPPADGIREAWSIQDAVDQWGVERRDPSTWVEEPEDSEEVVGRFNDWKGRDQILTRLDAAKAVGVSESTMRRMERSGHITPWEVTDAGTRRIMFSLTDVKLGHEQYRAELTATSKETTP